MSVDDSAWSARRCRFVRSHPHTPNQRSRRLGSFLFPAHLIVLIAAGGPHEANGEPYLGVAIFIIATMMWYGLIEGARRWWPHRRKRVHSSNA